MRAIVPSLLLLLTLLGGLAGPAGAAPILTTDVDDVVPWARPVVPGRVDRRAKTVEILERRVRTEDATLQTQAYWALAEALLAAAEEEAPD